LKKWAKPEPTNLKGFSERYYTYSKKYTQGGHILQLMGLQSLFLDNILLLPLQKIIDDGLDFS